MLTYKSIQELIDNAEKENARISDIVLSDQAEQMDSSKEEIYKNMAYSFSVMKESISAGINSQSKSPSGLSGGDAYKLKQAMDANRNIGGRIFTGMLARALAVSEVNACMGKIVAAPTAGSCGIIPAVLITLMEEKEIPEEKVIMGLFTAAGIGMVIANKATISGAEGGCQAECGSAAAMAAAAAVEMLGGSPQDVANACAIALKNMLGLVCDPVAGLVEVPCVKRNAAGASIALTAAELALAGIRSVIPPDEVIDAMRSVGESMPGTLKETAKGGLAATVTAKNIASGLKKGIRYC